MRQKKKDRDKDGVDDQSTAEGRHFKPAGKTEIIARRRHDPDLQAKTGDAGNDKEDGFKPLPLMHNGKRHRNPQKIQPFGHEYMKQVRHFFSVLPLFAEFRYTFNTGKGILKCASPNIFMSISAVFFPLF